MNETDKNYIDILFDYAVSIHGNERALEIRNQDPKLLFFLKNILASHNHLRSLNLEEHEYRAKVIKKDRATAYKNAEKFALENDWISNDQLVSMTVKELINQLYPRVADEGGG